jgi:lambda repressor-like predicted transcriptional regulator
MASDTPLDKALSEPRSRGEARRTLLRARGLTLADVARELGCHLSIVSRVNAAKKRSAVVERAIARRLGLRVRHAFPEWYGLERARRGPVRAPRVRRGRGSGR